VWCGTFPEAARADSLLRLRQLELQPFQEVVVSMVGVLVHGSNHFIVRGPLPDRATALALVRHWSVIQIGTTTPVALQQWRISTREFRENLNWAVVVPGDGDVSPAVGQLLDGLSLRGITIHNSGLDIW